MALTAKGEEIMRAMRAQYGEAEGTEIFYRSKNAGTITGVDTEENPAAAAEALTMEPTVRRAAGILFAQDTGHVLLLRRAGRDHAGEWAIPGGGIEGSETPEAAARRETLEEIGLNYTGLLLPWTRRVREGVDYTTFLARAGENFEPKLNDEHDGSQWVDRFFAMDSPRIHPGVRIALRRFDLDELGIAKAMRDGELTSPQRYANIQLVDIRITGTGLSYRTKLNEYVWRDSSIYLTAEFLERSQGLPVILDHPPGKPFLNGQEFKRRIVGTVFIPYIRGNEVWAIAKIWDEQMMDSIEDDILSTSPCVVFANFDTSVQYKSDEGRALLVEGKPALLDHLAICLKGVWDKGGEASGIESIDARADEVEAVLQVLRASQIDHVLRRVNL